MEDERLPRPPKRRRPPPIEGNDEAIAQGNDNREFGSNKRPLGARYPHSTLQESAYRGLETDFRDGWQNLNISDFVETPLGTQPEQPGLGSTALTIESTTNETEQPDCIDPMLDMMKPPIPFFASKEEEEAWMTDLGLGERNLAGSFPPATSFDLSHIGKNSEDTESGLERIVQGHPDSGLLANTFRPLALDQPEATQPPSTEHKAHVSATLNPKSIPQSSVLALGGQKVQDDTPETDTLRENNVRSSKPETPELHKALTPTSFQETQKMTPNMFPMFKNGMFDVDYRHDYTRPMLSVGIPDLYSRILPLEKTRSPHNVTEQVSVTQPISLESQINKPKSTPPTTPSAPPDTLDRIRNGKNATTKRRADSMTASYQHDQHQPIHKRRCKRAPPVFKDSIAVAPEPVPTASFTCQANDGNAQQPVDLTKDTAADGSKKEPQTVVFTINPVARYSCGHDTSKINALDVATGVRRASKYDWMRSEVEASGQKAQPSAGIQGSASKKPVERSEKQPTTPVLRRELVPPPSPSIPILPGPMPEWVIPGVSMSLQERKWLRYRRNNRYPCRHTCADKGTSCSHTCCKDGIQWSAFVKNVRKINSELAFHRRYFQRPIPNQDNMTAQELAAHRILADAALRAQSESEEQNGSGTQMSKSHSDTAVQEVTQTTITESVDCVVPEETQDSVVHVAMNDDAACLLPCEEKEDLQISQRSIGNIDESPGEDDALRQDVSDTDSLFEDPADLAESQHVPEVCEEFTPVTPFVPEDMVSQDLAELRKIGEVEVPDDVDWDAFVVDVWTPQKSPELIANDGQDHLLEGNRPVGVTETADSADVGDTGNTNTHNGRQLPEESMADDHLDLSSDDDGLGAALMEGFAQANEAAGETLDPLDIAISDEQIAALWEQLERAREAGDLNAF